MKTRFASDNTILWQYLELAASSIEGAVHHGNHINFKCNVCGDSKSKRKKRGYLIFDKKHDVVYYKCFNYGDCPAAEKNIGGEKWLKKYYPLYHKQYRSGMLNDVKTSTENLSNKVAQFRKKIVEKTPEEKAVQHFVPILKGTGEIFTTAINVCLSRRLPDAVWRRFYVATDGIYRHRLIIPFFDASGAIYYYQARSLVGQDPKYLNRKIGRDSAIYGLYDIDKTKPVIVMEGCIDSMQVENAVAILGLTLSEEVKRTLSAFNCRYLLDNDIAGKTKSAELLRLGNYVFLWDLFIKEYRLSNVKDINEAYILLNKTQKFSIVELDKFFTNSYFDLIYLQ